MLSSMAAQADVAHGKALVEKSCTACHTSTVYSRSDRRIKNLIGLQRQVSGCTRPAKVSWNKQDITDVVEYLNKEFYHFKK